MLGARAVEGAAGTARRIVGLTAEGPLVWRADGAPKPLAEECARWFRGGQARDGVWLADGAMAFSTAKQGVIVLEREGRVRQRIDRASGLATDLLARSDAQIAAIFGAGRQARTQLLALCAVRPIRRVFIYAPRASAVAELIGEIGSQLPDVELLAASSRSEAVRAAVVMVAVPPPM